ncbi:hypothetical protein BJX63DRAFT_433178 [Aspergillus granulosus]|uniref:Myb-like domain-containing protein n=1 Tax=Aspergillus granulosus TaxID=176169 RepID=A0ABR4H8A7_9EURO
MSYDSSRVYSPTEDSKSFTPINSLNGQELDAAMKMRQEGPDEDVTTQNAKETKPTPVKQMATPTKGTSTGVGISSSPRKRVRKTSNSNGATPRKAALPPIPASLAEAGAEDKTILNLRDGEGKSWPEITKLFISITGIQVGSTTLRLRYGSMKAKFVEIPTEDAARLLCLKREIEDKFEIEKWARIQEAIVTDGGGKYPVAALQKKFKQLNKAGMSAASLAAGDGNTSAAIATIVSTGDGEGAEGDEE